MNMECEECHDRPATLHLTKVINGETNEIHVCESCAKSKGYIAYNEEAYTIHDLLAGLFNFGSAISPNEAMNQSDKGMLTCPSCGMTYQQFNQVGKFGCTTCYETFSEHLVPIFRRVHSGNTTHKGKIPKRQRIDLEMERLIKKHKVTLQRYIENEQFEKAAEMRDKIKSIENSPNHDGKKDGD